MSSRVRCVGAALVVLAIAVEHADAGVIPGLWNTGVGAPGSTEQHYTVQNGDLIIGREPNLGATYWQYPASAQAEWIYLTNATSNPEPPFHTYRLQFDLTGYDPDTAWFAIRWLMDNAGSVALNGHEIINSRSGYGGGSAYYGYYDPNYYGFSAVNAVSFKNESYFQTGLNTLDFVVLDGGGATGLYVEFTGSNADVVPEPASLGLLALGGLALLRRRRG
jgi:hypothetical protein